MTASETLLAQAGGTASREPANTRSETAANGRTAGPEGTVSFDLMSGFGLVVSIVVWLILFSCCSYIGREIGKHKHQGVLGAILGGLAGPLGVIITVILPPPSKGR